MKRAPLFRQLIFVAVLLALVAQGGRVCGQAPPPSQASIFRDAEAYAEYGWWPQAIVEFKRIAEAHRGTEIEAIARERMIRAIEREYSIRTFAQRTGKGNVVPLDSATRAEILEQIDRLEAGFPNTQYDFGAKLMRGHYEGNYQPQLVFNLLKARTGVAVLDVLRGRPVRVSGIPLGKYYDYLSRTFEGAGQYLLEKQPQQFPEGKFYLMRFLRESFPFSKEDDPVMEYFRPLREGTPPRYTLEIIPPQVRVVSPRVSQTRSARPRFRIETVVGDYRYGQVDLKNVELTVDGVDLRPYLRVTTRITRRPKLNRPIERLRLEGRLPNSLAAGDHRVHLFVPAWGLTREGVVATTLDWTFRIQPGHEPDDEREGWCDEGRDDEP